MLPFWADVCGATREQSTGDRSWPGHNAQMADSAGVWESGKRKVEEIHQWRERRACFGELVQWDTSDHDWLEGRGEHLYLIARIDDATSRVYAGFVRHDTAEENMRVLWGWVERYGRPLAFYTDKAAMFETTPKSAWTKSNGSCSRRRSRVP